MLIVLLVKEPDEKNEKTYLDETITNTSNTKQDSIIMKDDVRPNDHKVLEVLGEDGSSYTFKGLMRKLGIHQESLSRSLHRLDELGLVEKSKLGYKLSNKGTYIRKSNSNSKAPYIPLLQTYIPSSVSINSIVGTLVGRWFKNLRWLGMIESEMGHMLQWISEYGSFQLNLRIVGNYIIIETNADDSNKAEAMVCAYRIFEHLSKLYSNSNVLAYTFSNDKYVN